MTEKLYQFKISLQDSPEPLWIRILIGSDSSFVTLRHLVKTLTHTYNFAHNCRHLVYLEKIVPKSKDFDHKILPQVLKRKGHLTKRIYRVIHHGEPW